MGAHAMTTEEISFTDFIASSIHDMKNSLNVQVSGLEGLAAACRTQGDSTKLEVLGPIIYQAHRMSANLVQLLSLYKLGKSIYPVDISEQPVADVISEAVLQNRSVMAFKGIAIEVDCDPACYWYFDRDLVTGILLNALNNAYNYTIDKIRIAAHIDAGGLVLRVEDNGRGYPAHMLQSGGVDANKGVNFSSGSTGLGFHFSSLVAHMHQNGGQQGSLTIENGGAYGGGCFVVRLP